MTGEKGGGDAAEGQIPRFVGNRPQHLTESDTVAAILSASIEILDEVGEHGLRVAEVVKRSGASTGSVYHFFGDRDGLIKSARAKQFRESQPTYGDLIADLVKQSNSASEFLGHLQDRKI